MKIAIIIASLGRPRQIESFLSRIILQSRLPDRIIISVESSDDLPQDLGESITIVKGPRGASAQRNRGLMCALDSDVVVFVDDDFVLSRNFLRGIEEIFSTNQDVVGATGHVIADGVTRGGINIDHAISIVDKFDEIANQENKLQDVRHVYGCNMAFRTNRILSLRFDEMLPLYSWQEDVDIGARACAFGRVVKTNAFSGVHQGVAGGRTSGVKFGYSQVVNPIYLLKKGTMGLGHAIRIVSKNVLYNIVRSFFPESHIDRFGRLKGNCIGLVDLARGRGDPRRILEL